MIEIQYNGNTVQDLLQRIVSATQNTEPVMQAIGETVMEIAKQSFANSASPDGTPWERNSPVTLLRYLNITTGSFKKDGSLSKKGQTRLANKKPLIGQTGDLARQFSYTATADSVTIQNSMVYAAMQQFGGTRMQFPHLWGNIPARPFMPVAESGTLMPGAEQEIIGLMTDYLNDIIG